MLQYKRVNGILCLVNFFIFYHLITNYHLNKKYVRASNQYIMFYQCVCVSGNSVACIEEQNSWLPHFHYLLSLCLLSRDISVLFCPQWRTLSSWNMQSHMAPHHCKSFFPSSLLFFQLFPQEYSNSWQLLPGLLMELAVTIMWGICSQAERRVHHIFHLHAAIFHFNYLEHPTLLKDTAC